MYNIYLNLYNAFGEGAFMETEHSKPQIVHFDITSGKIENQKSFNGAPYIIFQKHTNESVSPHWHPQSEFWLIQEGIGKVTLDSTTYNVRQATLCISTAKSSILWIKRMPGACRIFALSWKILLWKNAASATQRFLKR